MSHYRDVNTGVIKPYINSIDGAALVTVRNANGDAVDFTPPARDVYMQWLFGQDDTFSSALTPGSPTAGLAMDARHIGSSARTILIKASGATNFDYQILGGRNNNIADAGILVATVAGVTTTETLVNIPATAGYAPWLFLKITNNSGAATYKAVLMGRGG